MRGRKYLIQTEAVCLGWGDRFDRPSSSAVALSEGANKRRRRLEPNDNPFGREVLPMCSV